MREQDNQLHNNQGKLMTAAAHQKTHIVLLATCRPAASHTLREAANWLDATTQPLEAPLENPTLSLSKQETSYLFLSPLSANQIKRIIPEMCRTLSLQLLFYSVFEE